MIKPRPGLGKSLPDSAGPLLVTQDRINVLFEYSLDPYQVPAPTTDTRCLLPL